MTLPEEGVPTGNDLIEYYSVKFSLFFYGGDTVIGVRFLVEAKDIFLSILSKPALGLLPPGKGTSCPCNAEVKNGGAMPPLPCISL
jgi:hypothetical protein